LTAAAGPRHAEPAPRDAGRRLRFVGGNRVELLQGGDELFPRMREAIAGAEREVWLATYIFSDDDAAHAIAETLAGAARRGVAVHVVVDGFGSMATLARLRAWLDGAPVRLEVFRPIDRWWAWLQPGQLRRLHQKVCVVDGRIAFCGGINVIDDRFDASQGWFDSPRLDFAVAVHGPLAQHVHGAARAVWARAHLGRGWRDEMRRLTQSAAPVERTVRLLRRLRAASPPGAASTQPVQAAFVVRDNFRQRRSIERSFIQAIRRAQDRVDIAVPYFYPGRGFRRVLRQAALRGVRVRLLLQGKVDYRIAALAAQALYAELRSHGVRIFEYTPAFLHAKVAVVDDDWATVGSSNIDPLSLLLNLEANVVVRDRDFAAALSARLDAAIAASREVDGTQARAGWRAALQRRVIAWIAGTYLRVGGVRDPY
jgi:cardiolipin synthase A/B